MSTRAPGEVVCLGCGESFRGVRELRAEAWRHDADCERPGEVWR